MNTTIESRKNVIVVLNYNDWEETKRYCMAVKDFNAVDIILIVDNQSPDDSVERLKPLLAFEKIKLVKAQANRGYAAGNNVGLQYIIDNGIKGNVIISNPDIYYNNEDLMKVLEPLDDPAIGISTGLIHSDGKITSNFGWMQPGYWELLFNQYRVLYKIKRILHRSMYCDYPKEGDERVYCNCVSGCFFALTTETLEQIGLFDERTFLYGEENILGFKVKKNGQKACVVVKANIEHRQHHSIKKNKIRRKRNEKWNLDSMLIYVKYYLKRGTFYQKLFKASFWMAYYEKQLMGKISSFFH